MTQEEYEIFHMIFTIETILPPLHLIEPVLPGSSTIIDKWEIREIISKIEGWKAKYIELQNKGYKQ